MIHVRHAAAAIASGLCETVLIIHGESGRSGVGRTRNVVAPTSLAGQFEQPYGPMGPPTLFAIPVLRYMKTYGLSHEQLAMVSVVQRQWAANWVMGDLFGALNRLGVGIEKSPVSAGQIGALIDLIADGTISGRLAKDVFAEMVASGADPAAIVEAKGLRQVTDEGAIASAIDAVLTANADKVAEYRAGRDKLYGFFVGQVMRATKGKANPALVNRLLKSKRAG